jgi:hypothetical protein
MAMEKKNIIAVSVSIECLLLLMADSCKFQFCVMRKERHKSGLEKKKKLFRKRNFSSG